VAAIEKLIGQPIPWMGAPPAAASEPAPPVTPRQHEREQPRRGRSETPRQPQRGAAPVARIDGARPQRPPQPARHRAEDSDSSGDASHLPAFLLRPVPLKA